MFYGPKTKEHLGILREIFKIIRILGEILPNYFKRTLPIFVKSPLSPKKLKKIEVVNDVKIYAWKKNGFIIFEMIGCI